MVYVFLFISVKTNFKPYFFILKAFEDILQHIKFVNWRIGGFIFFGVSNRLKNSISKVFSDTIQKFISSRKYSWGVYCPTLAH